MKIKISDKQIPVYMTFSLLYCCLYLNKQRCWVNINKTATQQYNIQGLIIDVILHLWFN